MSNRPNCARRLGVAFSLSIAASAVTATQIDYVLVGLGGNDFRYEYSVTNDGSLGAGVPIQLFDIFFDPALYDEASLTIVSDASLIGSWDQAILPGGIGAFPAFDAFATMNGFDPFGGIPDGGSLGGFAVEFSWLPDLALSSPGSQPFSVVDPNTFVDLESGNTTSSTGQVPSPPAVALLAAGLLGLAVKKRR